MDYEAQRYISTGSALRRTRALWLIASVAAIATVGCATVALHERVRLNVRSCGPTCCLNFSFRRRSYGQWVDLGFCRRLLRQMCTISTRMYNHKRPRQSIFAYAIAKEPYLTRFFFKIRRCMVQDNEQAAREAAYIAAIRSAQVPSLILLAPSSLPSPDFPMQSIGRASYTVFLFVARRQPAPAASRAARAARGAAAQASQARMADLIRYYAGLPPNLGDYRDLQARRRSPAHVAKYYIIML